MKKKIALLLCSTGNEAFAVGNVIIGAKKYLFQNLEIVYPKFHFLITVKNF